MGREGWQALQSFVRRRLVDTTFGTAAAAASVLAGAARVDQRLAGLTASIVQPALTDIAVQVAGLVAPGFVVSAGVDRLADLERYLAAVDRRLDRLSRGPQRDQALMHRVATVQEAYHELLRARPEVDASGVRWAIEELRVSLFAQSLRTKEPVSEKRILDEIRRLRG